jgi:hypothetical protein
MGWTFRKRKRLLPGIDLNIGKRSLGLSFGRRGGRLSVNTRRQKSVSLGLKGFFWRKRL